MPCSFSFLGRRKELEERFQGGKLSQHDTEKALEQLRRDELESNRIARQRVKADDFEIIKVIGRGAFGMVQC